MIKILKWSKSTCSSSGEAPPFNNNNKGSTPECSADGRDMGGVCEYLPSQKKKKHKMGGNKIRFLFDNEGLFTCMEAEPCFFPLLH